MQLNRAKNIWSRCLFFGFSFCFLFIFIEGTAESGKTSIDTPDGIYDIAKKRYYSFKKSKNPWKNRKKCLEVIQAFKSVIQRFPESYSAYKATFTIAKLYQKLFDKHKYQKDFDQALNYYRQVVSKGPEDSLKDDAKFAEGNLLLDQKRFQEALIAFQDILKNFQAGDQRFMAKKRIEFIKSLENSKAPEEILKAPKHWVTISKIQFAEGKDSAKIKIDIDGPAEFSSHQLKEPDRFYLDVKNSRIDEGLLKKLPFKNKWLKGIRLSRHLDKMSRVVFDFSTLSKIDIKTRSDDSAIWVELRPKGKMVRLNGSVSKPILASMKKNGNPVSKAKEKTLIVLDPGHGGKDNGAQSRTGLMEKHLNLKISKMVKRQLEKKYGFKVLLTRNDDTFISLDKRGEIANEKSADLFVSIHANAAKRRGASGIETYYLGWGSSERARETASRENGNIVFSTPDNEVQNILADMDANRKINSSACLAGKVQNRLSKGMSKQYKQVKNLGVKEGPFYVLHKTYMPSILVEVGFVTNPMEERRLKNSNYLKRLADHIAAGIRHTFPLGKKCNPTI